MLLQLIFGSALLLLLYATISWWLAGGIAEGARCAHHGERAGRGEKPIIRYFMPHLLRSGPGRSVSFGSTRLRHIGDRVGHSAERRARSRATSIEKQGYSWRVGLLSDRSSRWSTLGFTGSRSCSGRTWDDFRRHLNRARVFIDEARSLVPVGLTEGVGGLVSQAETSNFFRPARRSA